VAKTLTYLNIPGGVDVTATVTFPSEYPLPTAQVSTLTPPAAITGFATSAKQLPDGHNVAVSNFPATQPVSGTFWPATQPVSGFPADYPLPAAQVSTLTPPAAITGFATSANQTGKNQYTRITDGTNDAAVIAGANTGVKGLRVYGGPTDPISDIPVWMEFDHHQIHEGESFRWSYVNTAGLAAGSSEDLVFTVPNISLVGSTAVVKCPHFRYEIVADSYSQTFLYEGPTVTGGTGTARTPVALERNGTYSPKLTILEKPTVTGAGTLLWQGILFAAGKAGAVDTPADEFVLKNNTVYLFRFTSQTNGCKFLVRFVWYEDLGV
jgi:hypothetical protein